MRAWSGPGQDYGAGDIMGPAVTRGGSAQARPNTPPLKNGRDLRESGYLIAIGSRTARFRRKHQSKLLLAALVALVVILLCLATVMSILYAHARGGKRRVCTSAACLRSAANLALSMDREADPCQDFYQFACGKWAEEHPRPDAYNSYDWFRDKQSRVYALVRDFLSKNTSHPRRPVQQAKDMYDACMDTERLDKLGLKPVLQTLESLSLPPYPTYINATDSVDYSNYQFDWLEAVIKIKTQLGMDVLIGFDIFTDPRNSSIYRLVMGSPETTNPFPSIHGKTRHVKRKRWERYRMRRRRDTEFINNNHYSERYGTQSDADEDEKAAQVYKLFYAELMKIFVIESGDMKKTKLNEIELDQNILLASNEYYSFSNDLYELETTNDTGTMDDMFLNIPEYTVDEIQGHTDVTVEANNGTATPIWRRYLEGVFGVSAVSLDLENDKVLVSEPDLKYMALMASFVTNAPPVIIELYVWVKVVEVMSVHTTTELRALFERAYESAGGSSASAGGCPPRTLQCANAVNDMLGMAIAYALADPHFLEVTKPKIQVMLDELKNALAHLVGTAKWMDDDTKLATYQKIIQMKTLVGFPDWLLEDDRLEEYYEGVEVDNGKHLENMIKILQVKIRKGLNKFRDGNNFTWATDPTEVNAYHTFQENTITVPMVMLQYPFYDLGLDSLNYGSLGTVLGHEITHGFDDFGRQFDKNGNWVPWWGNETVASFVNLTQCFVDQYNEYYLPELGEHVDGKRTLGENIADNGGLREAFAAFQKHLHKRKPEESLPGFEHLTSEQLFFLSYGNLWCGVWTRSALRAELADEHAPQRVRARAALANSAAFARAWRCPPRAPMNPHTKCVIF